MKPIPITTLWLSFLVHCYALNYKHFWRCLNVSLHFLTSSLHSVLYCYVAVLLFFCRLNIPTAKRDPKSGKSLSHIFDSPIESNWSQQPKIKWYVSYLVFKLTAESFNSFHFQNFHWTCTPANLSIWQYIWRNVFLYLCWWFNPIYSSAAICLSSDILHVRLHAWCITLKEDTL